MALPVAAIIAIVFGVWALLVLLIFALYQILKSRGSCSCECAPCGKDSEGGCSQCCISLSETCDCDCCKPNSGSCLDTVCPKKKVSCVDIILCQCCSEPGDQSCCIKGYFGFWYPFDLTGEEKEIETAPQIMCEPSDEPCSQCCEQPSKCFGGPACKFRPCDCGETEDDSHWNCSDLCCCECNYKSPAWMPHPTPSQQAQAGTPPRELIEKISLLNQSGYKLQVVGPDGKIRTLDTSPIGAHSPPSPVSAVMSAPVVAFQHSPMGSPRGHHSSPRLSDPGTDRFARAHYERMLFDHRMVSSYGRQLPFTGTPGPGRVLPPIPGSPGSSRGSQSVFRNHSERHIRTVEPS